MKPAQRNADKGAFFKSIRHTLMHLVLADKMWLTRFASQGVPVAALPLGLIALPEGSDYSINLHPDWKDLKRTRERLDAAMVACLQEMSPEFLSSTMHYANAKGVQRAHPMWQALTHSFFHRAHHRGQVTTLLTQAGVAIGVTDLIALIKQKCYVINSCLRSLYLGYRHIC